MLTRRAASACGIKVDLAKSKNNKKRTLKSRDDANDDGYVLRFVCLGVQQQQFSNYVNYAIFQSRHVGLRPLRLLVLLLGQQGVGVSVKLVKPSNHRRIYEWLIADPSYAADIKKWPFRPF